MSEKYVMPKTNSQGSPTAPTPKSPKAQPEPVNPNKHGSIPTPVKK